MFKVGNVFFSGVLLFIVFIFTSCINSTVSENRDYVLSITLNDSLTLDSVIVERKIESAIDTLRFYTKDIQRQDNAILISFDLQGNTGSSVSIFYQCFAHHVPVVEKSRSFTISGEGGASGENIRAAVIPILVYYQSNIQVSIPATPQDTLHNRALFEALFIDAMLIPGNQYSRVIFETYMFAPVADSAKLLTAVIDTLTGRGDQFPYLTLSDKISLDRDVLRVMVNSYRVAHPLNLTEINIPLIDSVKTDSLTTQSSMISESSQQSLSSLIPENQSAVSAISSSSTESLVTSTSSSMNSVLSSSGVGVSSRSSLSSSLNISSSKTMSSSVVISSSSVLSSSVGISSSSTLSSSAAVSSSSALSSSASVPVVTLTGYNGPTNKKDSLLFTWNGSDADGTIVEYAFKELQESAWLQLGTATSRRINNPGTKGVFSFVVRATDNDGYVVFDTTEVTIANEVPVAQNHTFQLDEEETDLLGSIGATDTDGDPLTYRILSGDVGHFTVGTTSGIIEVSSPLDYEVKGSYNVDIGVSDGEDSITVTIDVIVRAINDYVPVIVEGEEVTVSLQEDANQQDITISATDDDRDGAALQWSIVSQSNSSIAFASINTQSGILSVTPEENQFGLDSLIVSVSDGLYSDTILYIIDVSSVEDPTVFSGSLSMSTVHYEDSTATVSITGSCTDADNTTSVRYQWYRDTNSSGLDGIELSGETAAQYVETFADATNYLYVVVTCSGSESVSRSAYTSRVYYQNRKFIDGLKDSRDNNEYDIAYIGAQVWMTENLRFEEDFSKCSNDNISNCFLYGRVYTWDQVMDTSAASNLIPSGSRGICPTGWHVPSRSEFAMLRSYASSHPSGRPIDHLLKAISGWQAFPGGDSLGFSTRGHGYILSNGDVRDFRASGSYWTTSEYPSTTTAAYMAGFSYNTRDIHYNGVTKSTYHGVRCIRD